MTPVSRRFRYVDAVARMQETCIKLSACMHRSRACISHAPCLRAAYWQHIYHPSEGHGHADYTCACMAPVKNESCTILVTGVAGPLAEAQAKVAPTIFAVWIDARPGSARSVVRAAPGRSLGGRWCAQMRHISNFSISSQLMGKHWLPTKLVLR